MAAARALTKKASLTPDALTDPIGRAAAALGQAVQSWEVLHPLLVAALRAMGVETLKGLEDADGETRYMSYRHKDPVEIPRELWVREVGKDVAEIGEKLARTLTSLTKATDEATRLQDFLTGGNAERQDLASASDAELIETLIEVAIARRLVNVILKRARERGLEQIEVTAEVIKDG